MKPKRFVPRIMGSRVASLVVATALFLTALPSTAHAQEFVYVAGWPNSIAGFNLHVATGALTPIPGSPLTIASAPVATAVDRAGRYLYVLHTGPNSVSAYRIKID